MSNSSSPLADQCRVNQPAITVLIPAYRSAAFITPSLQSISAQTRGDFMAVVSVDYEDDATHQACLRHAEVDRRFVVIRQPQRLGWVGNSNALLERIRTPYALFAFHDDLLADTCLEKLTAALDADPQASVAFPDTLLTHVDGRQEFWQYTNLDGIDTPRERGLHILNRQGKWWVPNRGLFRTASAHAVGGLRTHDSGEFSADLPWLFHLALTGRFVRVPETLCFKYYKSGSLSRSWQFNIREHYDVLVACMREIWLSSLPPADKLALAEPLLVALKQAATRAYPPH